MPAWAGAATFVVNDDTTGPGPSGADCGNPDFATIQAAINAAPAMAPRDTIQICAGSYAENLMVAKSLEFLGAQAGVDARGRSATESTIAPAAGAAMLLQPGSAGSAIDGLTLSGGARGIDSDGTGGPLDGLSISNNRIVGFTGAGIFLSDPGLDITVDRNVVDGGSKMGAGGLVQLDTDVFDGLQLTDNNIVNGATATGLFVDGDHNVGMSVNRPPSLSGNLIQANQTGVNLGTRAFEFGSISGNTVAGSGFDGVQGGIQNSTISGNAFTGNGRSGLALTSFGNMGVDRGAQNTMVTGNTFTGNGATTTGEAIFFSSTQAPGTIATNQVHFNRFSGNNDRGTVYNGIEMIDLQNNWWGCSDGPGGMGCDTKAGTGAAGLDADPWLVLGVSANPTTIQVGGQTSQIAADLTRNSAGALAGPGFPEGTSVGFATTLGTILTPGPTSGGVATSTLTSGATPGAAAVSASLDNATAMVTVTIQTAAQAPSSSKKKCKKKRKKKRAALSKKNCKKKKRR
jgi:hypothetical protein